MAQFDIKKVQFLLESNQNPVELTVEIDNPENMTLHGVPTHNDLPSDVEVVAPGEQPTKEFWVSQDHYHLVIVLADGSSNNPLVVSNTRYYNAGSNDNYLDIVVAEDEGDGKKKTRKVRRASVIIFGGGD